tara:strand:+ start:1403 stop:2065 length:663 start_codon:yes stop_codon:yes gene_type:complete
MAGLHFDYWEESEIIHEGAEARVTSGLWLGIPAVLKARRKRGYRHPELDSRLTKSRITVEAKVLSRLQSNNFPSPRLLQLDLEAGWMVLSRLEGAPIYDTLVDKTANEQDLEMVGSIIRNLHELGFSHGDLTTHNIMIDKDRKISLLDFGLSRISAELEHFGQDLQVLNECLSASHSDYEGAIERVLSGYRGSSNTTTEPSAESVISRFNAIRNRVRYLG